MARFFGKGKREKEEQQDRFIKNSVIDYENEMEPYFDSAKTIKDFDLGHHQTKAAIVSEMASRWEEIRKGSNIKPDLMARATNAIDKCYALLKGQFESRLRNQNADPVAMNDALQYYSSKMDEFLKKNPSAKVDDLKTAHGEASKATRDLIKNRDDVNVKTLKELDTQLEESFEAYKVEVEMAEKSRGDPAIGIDLGTTNCCVMVYYNGDVEVVPNRAQGNSKTTPSYVSFLDDGSDTFGMVAKEEAFRYPETTIYDAKRMIGREWDDSYLQNDRKHWPFEIVDQRGQPKVKTWDQSRYPHEISARLLAQFRHMADEYLNVPMGTTAKAVITVPAYFTEPQRRATAEAAESAGLEVLSILSEPTAAAIAYSWKRKDKTQKRNTLIYDFGGGTFDVSIAVLEGNNVDVLAVDGDTHLGGQDFDQLLMDHCIQEFKETEGIDLMDGRDSNQKVVRDKVRSSLSRLKLQCEKAKERLAAAQVTTIIVDMIHQDKHLAVKVTRDEFEKMAEPLVRKTLTIVDRALTGIQSDEVKGREDIDDVILVGGTTRMPLVDRMLGEHFKGKQLHKTINPDEAVAFGAAVQAAILNHSGKIIPINVQDVTPMTIGTDVGRDGVSKLIPKNTKIPCELTKEYTFMMDNQTEMRFKIFQGESEKASENNLLGEFLLKGFPAKPAGEERAVATVKIDTNGLLMVTAVAKSTGSAEGITIESNRLGMDNETILNMKNKHKTLFSG